MKTMLVMAHYDDEVISSAEYLVQNPDTLIFVACGDNELRRPAFDRVLEVTGCSSMIGLYRDLHMQVTDIPHLATFLEYLVQENNIERVITHHPADVHQDHRIVNQATQIALRRLQNVELLYNKNPEGFPFTEVHWDTVLGRSRAANDLIECYHPVVTNLPKPEYEYYQSVRRFSI